MKNRISRKKIRRGFILLFLILFLSLTGTKVCFSQIQDSSFEEGIVGEKPKWWEFTSREASGQVIVDDGQKHWGKHSLKISLETLTSPDGEIKLRFISTILLRAGDEWILQYFAKLEKPELSGYASRMEVKIGNGKKIVLQATPPWDKLTEWNQYEIKFTVPSTEGGLYDAEININRGVVLGTVWFDDVQFIRISSSPPTVLAPSTARQGEKIGVKGGFFPPLQEVKISLETRQIQLLPKTQTDASGAFSIQIEIPKDIEAKYYSMGVLAGSYIAHTGIQILPPLEPKIFGIKIQVLKKDKALKVFKDGKIIIGSDETLIIEASGETDGKTKDSSFKASFYIIGVTPEKTVDNKIVYDKLLMQLSDTKLGIYKAEMKPRSNLEIASRVTIELNRAGQTNVLESEEIAFQTILVPGKIESVSINDSLIIIDEVLFITLIGESGQKPYASLYNPKTDSYFVSDVSLKETGTGTGVYKTEYKPALDKQAESLVVRGKISNDTKDAVEMVTINTKKPEIQTSVDKPYYANGEESWFFVKTDPDAIIAADVSSLDSTNPTVKFIQDSVRKGFFTANFIISKNNKANDGKKIIPIKVVNPVGNKNTTELTIVLKNKQDIEQTEIVIPEGLSILSLPLNPGDWTLKDLAGALGEELVMILFSEKGKFIPYLPSVISDTNANKKIEIGIGYILVMAKQKKVAFQGKSWATKPAPAAVIDIPDDWIKPIIRAIESLPWSEPVEIALGFLYKLKPPQTALFQNFPNPFNAETWIPFQISEPVDVEIKIYTASGYLVRKLTLGRKNIGVYKNRETAACWNGRNEQDEKITSGVYFYTIKAGNFTTTRKMAVVE